MSKATISKSRPGRPSGSTGRLASRRNDRLSQAMKATGVGFAELATVVGVHYKTAQRWVYEGRAPQTRDKALRAARVLGVEADWLWPRLPRLVNPDLVNVYDVMHGVPAALWRRLAQAATRVIEVASDAPPALPEDLGEVLKERAANGVDVRLCLGRTIDPPIEINGVATCRSDHDDMISIYRFDAVMLVWQNRGGPGLDRLGPVLHLHRVEDNGLFDAYAYVFARLWGEGRSIKRRP